MPTYQYLCKACGHEFEEWQSMSAEPLVTCPSCKQNTLSRVIGGGAGLIFKGSGFYLTDYKKDSSKSKEKEKSAASEKKSEKPSGEKPTKPEQKPAPKSDTEQ